MSEYFQESHWGQCLELLSHLCHYSESIVLVTGVEGIGKSAMKQALKNQEIDNFEFCDLQATAGLTSDQLCTRIEQDFDVVNDKDLLILIDDAQCLALDVISMVFQLKQKTSAEGRLHIVLFATNEFEQKIARSVLKEDFAEQVHAIEIEPLTLQEVEPFLRQQWSARYRNNEMPFDRAKCKKIYASSGGVPGKILEVIDHMDSKAEKDSKTQSLSPFTVGVTVSFGILFCILAILWPAADKSMLTHETSITEPLRVASQEPESFEDNSLATATTELVVETRMAEATPNVEPMQVTEVVTKQTTTTAVTELPETNVSIAVNSVNEGYEEKIAALEKKVTELQKQVASEQKALRVTEMKLQKLLAKKQPLTQSHKKIAKKSLNTGITKQEKEILALPGRNYTLQLLSMTDENKVKNFVKEHNLQHKANYYKSTIRGKEWYVLVYGNYTNKYDAQLALNKLPNTLKKLQPKARGYVDIQQAISNRGK